MPKAKRVKTDTGAATPAPRRSGRIAAIAEAASNASMAASTVATKTKVTRKGAGGKGVGMAEGKAGELASGTNTNDASSKTKTATVTTGTRGRTNDTSKTATKNTNTDPKTNVGKNTRKKTAKSTIKTSEKAAAGPKSKNANTKATVVKKKDSATAAKGRAGALDNASKVTISALEPNTQLTPPMKSDTATEAAAPSSPQSVTLTQQNTASGSSTANAIDPNRPIFYPSYLPHIMSSIISMCGHSEQLKFRGVSRWCQEETHRIARSPHGSHAVTKLPHEGYRSCHPEYTQKRRFLGKGSPNEIRRRHDWTIKIVDHATTFADESDPFVGYQDSRLLLAHTVRYYLEGPTRQTFFPPNLQTVVLFFHPHNGCCHRAPPTARLVNPTLSVPVPSISPRLPNPTITKVVLNVPDLHCDEWYYSGTSLMSRCLDRVIEAILACPATVSNLTVVFSVQSFETALSRQVFQFWDKFINALSTKTHATITLVDVATMCPRTAKRWDPSTFPPAHTFINAKYQRRTRTTNLQVTAMTRDEYKAKVGEQQYKIDTDWSAKVIV